MPTMLMAFNWPGEHERHRRLSRFVDTFFTKFPDIQKPPRHPRWKNINLAATVQGWTRFAPAQAWIDKVATAAPVTTGAATPAPAGTIDAAANEARLFKEFLEWRRKQGTRASQ